MVHTSSRMSDLTYPEKMHTMAMMGNRELGSDSGGCCAFGAQLLLDACLTACSVHQHCWMIQVSRSPTYPPWASLAMVAWQGRLGSMGRLGDG